MENLQKFVSELLSYKGRVGRWKFVIIWVVLFAPFYFIQLLATSSPSSLSGVGMFSPTYIILLGFLLLTVVLQVFNVVKRLHDMDFPGFFAIALVVPILNFIVILFLLFRKGTTGPNKYGEDPLKVAV